MPVPEPAASLLSLLDAANERLLHTLDMLIEADVRAPSALPGWTRGHILAHLVNNADGNRHAAWGAAHDLVLENYPGGRSQRDQEIESHADWPAETLVNELKRATSELQAAWSDMPAEAWTKTVVRTVGPRTAWNAVQTRLMEVEAHHVDLALDYTARDWLPEFVELYLPIVAQRVVQRSADGAHGLWRIERSDARGEWTIGAGGRRGQVKGPGDLLLGWLMGRAEASNLEIEGDAEVAATIPRLYPYG